MTNPPQGNGTWPVPPTGRPSVGNSDESPNNQADSTGPWIAPQHPAPNRSTNGWQQPPQQQPTQQTWEGQTQPPQQPSQPPTQPTQALGSAPQQRGPASHNGWVTPPAAYQGAPGFQGVPGGPGSAGAPGMPGGPWQGYSASGGNDKKKWPFVVVGGLLAIAVVAAGGWFLLKPKDEETVTQAPRPSESSQSGDQTTEGGSDPTATEAVETDPEKRLEQLKDGDAQIVKDELSGRWVPQLSSKKEGIEAEGKTWTLEDIVEEHEQLREDQPRVKLIWSGDWNSFKMDDFWVSVVGIGYTDKEDALRWCSSNGFDADHCYAKKLTTSGGSDGTTYRG